MHVRCLVVLALALAISPLALAAPDKANPADAKFSQLYKEWKAIVARLYQLQQSFQRDPAADKTALQNEYSSLLVKAQETLPNVSEAAEKSYAASPNKNKERDSFLMANLTGYVMANDFEKATKVGKLLADNHYEAKELNLLTGLAAFCSNDFEDAEKYLKLAAEAGVISQIGQRYLDSLDKYKEMWAKEKALRQAEDRANDLPRVRLTTTKGDIDVVLFENEAPIATANFISLVEKKFYDGLAFHRVVGDFMAQAGDPKGDGKGGPGYTIPCECYQENHRNHFRGSLSMGNTGKRDSAGSQFFFTFLPSSHLDGKHTVFGRIVEGMDVLAKLQRTEPPTSSPPDKILKATVISKRSHPYVPVTRPDKA